MQLCNGDTVQACEALKHEKNANAARALESKNKVKITFCIGRLKKQRRSNGLEALTFSP